MSRAAAAPPEPTRVREHLANERTLLAWVRTAIAFMGLGFVVARFGLFLRQVALERQAPVASESGLAGYIGIGLVAVGLLATVLSAIRFVRVRAQIEAARFEPEVFPEVVILSLTLLGGAMLVAYLAVTR
jgi:putative membrane protein